MLLVRILKPGKSSEIGDCSVSPFVACAVQTQDVDFEARL